MSLEQLRAQAAEEEQEAASTEEETQDEQEPEEAQEAEPEEGSSEEESEGEEAESSEFELTLDGEPEPDRQNDNETVPLHKFMKEKGKRQEARKEVEDLNNRIAELEAQLKSGSGQSPQPVPTQMPEWPDLYDRGIDGDKQKHAQAVAKYHADVEALNSQQQQAEKAKQQWEQSLSDAQTKLAESTVKFVKEHKIDPDKAASAIHRAQDSFDETAGFEGALAQMLSSVGEGGERVAYYLGTNDAARNKMEALLKEDSQFGFKVIAEMTRLAERLKPKGQRKPSNAPEPDEALRGDGSTPSARKLQEEYDKASDKSDLRRMRELKRQAEAKGVTLN